MISLPKLCALLLGCASINLQASAQEGSDIAPNPAAGIIQEFDVDHTERMTVQVQVNGSEAVPFIVDTGAERTVIANDFAKRLLLDEGPKLTLATISGRAEVNSFFIERLTSAAVNLEGVEAPGLERSNLGAYGLLGIDSLEDSRVLLDFIHQKMEVTPSNKRGGRGKFERGMIIVSAKRRAGRMILSSARIDGVPVDIILDTGAQATMGNAALRKKLTRRHRMGDYKPVIMKSVTGSTLLGEYTQIQEIEIDSLTIKGLPITFSDNYAFTALKLNDRPAILLGMDSLKLFDRVVIDFGNRRVGFDLPNGAARPQPSRLAANIHQGNQAIR
jgi:predicted aspartyl protease